MIKKKVAVILLLASIISPVKANAIELSKDKSITVEDAYQEKTLKENRKVSFSSNSIITLKKDKTISGSIGDGKNIKKVTLYINGEKFQEISVDCNDEVYNFSLKVPYLLLLFHLYYPILKALFLHFFLILQLLPQILHLNTYLPIK